MQDRKNIYSIILMYYASLTKTLFGGFFGGGCDILDWNHLRYENITSHKPFKETYEIWDSWQNLSEHICQWKLSKVSSLVNIWMENYQKILGLRVDRRTEKHSSKKLFLCNRKLRGFFYQENWQKGKLSSKTDRELNWEENFI